MAFGIKRHELQAWKDAVLQGELAFLTHYWTDPRFPHVKTVTKVGCRDWERLAAWCKSHGLNPAYIHNRPPYPHFDLLGPIQLDILRKEGQLEQIRRFRLEQSAASFTSS